MGGLASSVAALGSGIADGDVGMIRVSQGGEYFTIQLLWDAVAQKWISARLPVSIEGNDGDWTYSMNNPGTGWNYWGLQDNSGGNWKLLAGGIPFAGALYAAGLRLQDRIHARILDPLGVVRISPWFYEYNSGDPLVFSNDVGAQVGKTWNGVADEGFMPSPENIGHGVVLASDGSNTIKMYGNGTYDDGILTSGYHSLSARAGGWDYVRFFQPTQPAGSALGGVPTAVEITPSKKFLYPTLYGQRKQAAMISWECRWAS